jgi:DNA polymerase-3 subunit alpha/error-prone DNA polymerase
MLLIEGLLHRDLRHTADTEKDHGGEFRFLGDFSRKVRLKRDNITALCPAGVFDGISGGLARTMQAQELLKSNTGAREKRQDELFPEEGRHRSGGAGFWPGSRK